MSTLRGSTVLSHVHKGHRLIDDPFCQFLTLYVGPGDYQSVTRTLTFSQSNRREAFAVQIQGDTIDEEDEEFRAVLSTEVSEDSVRLNPVRTMVTIRDDDSKF